MGAHPAGTSETYQYLKSVINGAAPLADSDMRRFLNKVKVSAHKDVINKHLMTREETLSGYARS